MEVLKIHLGGKWNFQPGPLLIEHLNQKREALGLMDMAMRRGMEAQFDQA